MADDASKPAVLIIGGLGMSDADVASACGGPTGGNRMEWEAGRTC